MSLETMTQTEVKDPAYAKIAEAILTITDGGREQCHDQETIRVMVHAFARAVTARDSDTPCEVPRRHY